MKKSFYLFVILALTIAMSACGKQSIVADYGDAAAFEAALNTGENLEGKIVIFEAGELHPDSMAGFDVWAGEHLNFISKSNPNIKTGDIVAVRAKTIESMVGSWFITYEKLEGVEIGDSTIVSDKATEDNTAQYTTSQNESLNLDAIADNQDIKENNAGENVPEEEIKYEAVDLDAAAFRDYFGKPKISSYAIIRNTGNVPIKLEDLRFDYEDNSGKLLTTDSHVVCIPDAIAPGQLGYIYSYYHSMEDVNLDNGFKITPQSRVSVANDFYAIEVSDVSFGKSAGLDIKVIGRGTNNTGTDQPLAKMGAVYFDKDNNVVGFCYSYENFPDGQTTTFEMSGDLLSEDMDPSIVDHVEVYIQGASLW